MAVKRVSRGQRQARRVRISITANYQLFCDYQQTFLKMIEMDNKQIIYSSVLKMHWSADVEKT